MKTYTFKFEYSTEADSAEDAARECALAIEDDYDFRSCCAVLPSIGGFSFAYVTYV